MLLKNLIFSIVLINDTRNIPSFQIKSKEFESDLIVNMSIGFKTTLFTEMNSTAQIHQNLFRMKIRIKRFSIKLHSFQLQYFILV
jgi:hypothetical protein